MALSSSLSGLMQPVQAPSLRPLGDVLGRGIVTGVLAGATAGVLDAIWSWGPAGQFLPGIGSRLRFVAFAATSHAAYGALLGLAVTATLLVLSRASRLGDLARFAWRAHVQRRTDDPRQALAGIAIVIASVPCIAIALGVAHQLTAKFVAGRKTPELVVVVAMATGLVSVAAALPIGFVLGRTVEAGLQRLPARWVRWLSCPYVAIGAIAAVTAAVLAVWALRQWETTRVLPLRGPLVMVIGFVVAVPLASHASRLIDRLAAIRPAIRRGLYAVMPIAVIAAVLIAGGSAPVIKASSAYTGLGGPIARTMRRAFDWDGDGYARFLGGGDCDDGDPLSHPGAFEVPDDGIDQNCVGGDPSLKRSIGDVGFTAVPPGVPSDARILLITIDTMRADHLGAYGYQRRTSPNLDKLAAEGTLFEHSWAHAPSTRYSIPAILTGRLPLDVYYDTSIDGWPGLSPKATTIAEALKARGLVGGAITNYWYFDKSRQMDQGFSEYDNENASRHSGVANAGPEQTKGSSSKEQTDKAIKFVERHATDRWFLWVHYYDPHYAYEPHPELPSFGTDRMALYDGEIQFTDHHIGRLLDELRARGLYDKTIIVVTGDHGEGFGEHGIELHGYHLYAPQTRVPLIIRAPGIAPRKSSTPAGHTDILPTLVNLVGGTPTQEIMGRSLLGAMIGNDADRVVFQQLSYEGNHELRAGVSQRCHVIYNVSPDTSWEVYRTDRDALEAEDLAATDECSDTRHAVERWFDTEQIPAGAAEALLTARPPIGSPLDASLGDSVRLLGVDVAKSVKRGEPITLTWTFEAVGKVEPGWKLFAHLEGPNKMMLNGDHRPARPFEWWKPGQFIRYSTTVVVPRTAPTGTFTVWTGMFSGKRRAQVTAAKAKIQNNAIAAATFEVTP
ncbi:MAG: sulfatase [Kofleriaceae bacterium]